MKNLPTFVCLFGFFSISKKKKKSSDRPIIFCTSAVFFLFCFVFCFCFCFCFCFVLFVCLFVFSFLFFSSYDLRNMENMGNTNIWKAWMLKLEFFFCFFDLEKKKAFTHTHEHKKKGGRKGKNPDRPTLNFFLRYGKQTYFFLCLADSCQEIHRSKTILVLQKLTMLLQAIFVLIYFMAHFIWNCLQIQILYLFLSCIYLFLFRCPPDFPPKTGLPK